MREQPPANGCSDTDRTEGFGPTPTHLEPPLTNQELLTATAVFAAITVTFWIGVFTGIHLLTKSSN